MTLQWADFPSNQKGLYGLNPAAVLNGTPWIKFSSDSLTTDPDPLGQGGTVMKPSVSNITDADARLALTTSHQKVGVAFRLWFTSIPVGSRPIVALQDGTTSKYILGVTSSGALEIRRGTATIIATTTGPWAFANSWNHFEIVADVVTGDIEVRRNGNAIAELTITDGAPPGGVCSTVAIASGYPGGGSSDGARFKDFIVYNGAGSEINDFLGSVVVNDLYPDSDDDLQWTPSSGATGWNLVKDNTPGNRLTVTGAISNAETVTLGTVRYSFTDGSVDAGAPAGTLANPWLVNRGASAEDALANLSDAINATGTPGVTYSTALTAHPLVGSVGATSTILEVEPLNGSTIGLSCAETLANGSWLDNSTFYYGPSDSSYVAAGFTAGPVYPDPTIFTLTDLDEDVTSVKGLISIVRAYKTDGGDGNIQFSMSSNGVDWDDSADTPLTTAGTYYWDTSALNPDTAAPWTPAEVNALLLKLNRTL